ncbi:MAG: FG-GAP-like repeat-containing protein [Bacteroidota bacterium]
MNRSAASALLVLAWLVPVSAQALSDRFPAPFAAYETGLDLPAAAATADFNGDGRPDVALALHGVEPCTVVIQLGLADGRLGPPTTIATFPSSEPTSLSAGDMDGDGFPDLVITRRMEDALQVILNRGGAWTVVPPSSVAPDPLDAAIADMNHDGILDVVAASYGPGLFSVYLGRGDGALGAPASLVTTAPGPCAVAIGDPNLDGNPDVVVASRVAPVLAVHFGDGSGAFGPGLEMGLGDASPAWDVVCARIDDDVYPDIAAISPGSGTISFFHSTGEGTFVSPNSIAPAYGTALTAADVNGDGRADLAYSGGGLPSGAVFLGNGMGAFAAPLPFKAGSGPVGILSARLAGDQTPDLVVPCSSGVASVLLGHGDGTFGANIAAAAGGSPRAVAIGELNGDALPDAVVSDEAAGGVQVIPGNLVPDPGPPNLWDAGGPVTSVALADLDGDADSDIAAALSAPPPGNLKVLRNDGTGAFPSWISLSAGSDPRGVVARDLNRDGRADLVVPNGTDGTVSIYLQGGRSGFIGPNLLVTEGVPVAVAATDLVGDTNVDLAIAEEGGDVVLYVGDGTGAFTVATAVATPSAPRAIATGDWTGDGRLDLAVLCPDVSAVAVFASDPGGFFYSVGNFPCGNAPSAIAAADLDADGHPDLVVSNPGQNTVSFLRGLSYAGDFAPPEPVGTGAEPRGLAIADLDQDGDRDLVVADSQEQAIQVLANTPPPPIPDLAPSLRWPPSPIVEVGGRLSWIVTAADLDGDPIASLTASGLPPGASFTTSADQTSGTVTFTPSTRQTGDYPVTFTASNALAGSAQATIHVADASTKASGLFLWKTTDQDVGTHVVRFRAANKLGEVSRDSVVVTVAPSAPGAAPRPGSPSGVRATSISGAPPGPADAALAPGQATKGPVISVTGDLSVTSGGTVTLDVTGSGTDTLSTNTTSTGGATFATDYQPEVVAPAHVSATPGQAVSIQVSASDPDQDAIASLTADLASLPAGNNATFTSSADHTSGTFTWTPGPGTSGTFGVTFTAANALVGTAGTEIHVASGPVSYWKLNDDGSDELGAADLAPVGSPGYGPARLGDGLAASGTGSDGLQGTATTAHDVQGPWTVELWTNPGAATGADAALFSASDPSGENSWLVGVGGDGRAWFGMSVAGGSGWNLRSTATVTGGAWHHVAFTTDGTAMNLYVDGNLEISGNQGGKACVVHGGAIRAGLGLPPGVPPRAGGLDEVRVWNVCRTQDQIVASMNAEIPEFATGVGSPQPSFRNALRQNAPNPFNPRTAIAFETARAGRVRLRVFDAAGRLVATLIDRDLPAGNHRAAWLGTDARGHAAASGVYFYRLEAPGYVESRRMALMR